MRIKIEKTGINGEGIGYWQQKPIFIQGALPQEEVEIIDIQEQDRFSSAKLVRVVKASSMRVEAPCPYQAKCGGCPLMIADYPAQLRLKEQNLKQTLLKYMGNFDFRLLKPIRLNASPLGYRNACKLPVRLEKGKLVAGFYQPNSNIFLPIETCILHDASLEKAKKAILEILNQDLFPDFDPPQSHGLRTLVLRAMNQQIQVTLVTGKMEICQALIEKLMTIEGVVSLYQSINTDKHAHDPIGEKAVHLAGLTHLPFIFASLKFELHPKAFFQLNRFQAFNMFEDVVKLIKTQSKVVDVYCGVGAISLMLAQKAKAVIGIETVQDAIDSALRNASLNGIANARFIAGDAAKVLKSLDFQADTLVVDPPRSGLDAAMVAYLNTQPVKEIVYVSCNPSTLAKNLAELKRTYQVLSIQPYDLFSQTPLVEVVVHLRSI